MLTKIIYKNFRSNFKNYVAFFIGNMMGVTEFFVFWGLYSIVKNMSANSVMLEDTLEEIIISVSVITIFSTALMVYSMLNYIKKRIADYSLFYILGMKKQIRITFVLYFGNEKTKVIRICFFGISGGMDGFPFNRFRYRKRNIVFNPTDLAQAFPHIYFFVFSWYGNIF